MAFEKLNELNVFNDIVEVCFGIDILLRFFHGYKDKETFEEVTDYKKIWKNYAQ